MKIDWKKWEIPSRIFVAIAGLALSASLVWSEAGNRSREEGRQAIERQRDLERLSYDTLRRQEETLTREFQSYYGMARDAGSDPALRRSDLDLAGSIAQLLAGKPFEKGYYKDAIVTLRARLDAAQQLPGESNGQSATILQSEIGGTPINAEAWFAVVASYSAGEPGKSLAIARAQSLVGKVACPEVWRSRKSGVYAVVAGGKVNRTQALTNAQRARLTRIAPDAFTQADNGLERITSCLPSLNLRSAPVRPV